MFQNQPGAAAPSLFPPSENADGAAEGVVVPEGFPNILFVGAAVDDASAGLEGRLNVPVEGGTAVVDVVEVLGRLKTTTERNEIRSRDEIK
jgi:hypothetical protein